ncbi:MAG: PQQ-binding-like beta-propeller repeat protein [Halobacteriaceae archaeon]
MPSLTRRSLLGGAAALAAGAYGAHRLDRGATDAAFETWSPAPGTWPLPRYDPANTAHSPHAAPPRESPTRREVASVSADAEDPYFRPLVGADRLALYGRRLSVYLRRGGEAVRASDVDVPHAGFGPDGRLYAVRRDPDDFETPSALVGYAPEGLRESARFPLDTDHPYGLTVGEREVYVGTPGREIHAFDPGSSRGWRVGGSKTALADGRLYATAATRHGTVAYEERTGLDRRLRVGPERVWSAGWLRGETNPPAVADGRVAVGSYGLDGGAVVAYDADSGERLWDPRTLGLDVSTPAVVGDRGYVAVGTDGLEAGLVAALDLATGETVWRDDVDWYAFAPAVGGDTLVVAGEVRGGQGPTAGRVRAYDVGSGEALWTVALDADPDGLALAGDRVLVTAGASLYELA